MKFSDITKIAPLFTGLLIFSSIVKNVFYFNLFGIPIIDYLTIQEALKLFLQDILLFSIASLLFVLNSLQYTSVHLGDFIRRRDSEQEALNSNLEFRNNFRIYLALLRENQRNKRDINSVFTTLKRKRRVLKKMDRLTDKPIKIIYIIIIIVLLLSVLAFLNTFSFAVIPGLVGILFATIFSYFITFSRICTKLFPDATDLQVKTLNGLIALFVALNVFSISLAYTQYYKLITYLECRNALILTKNETIKAFSSEYYIVQTEIAVFTYYDQFIARSISKADVVSISFQKSMDITPYRKCLNWLNEAIGIRKSTQ